MGGCDNSDVNEISFELGVELLPPGKILSNEGADGRHQSNNSDSCDRCPPCFLYLSIPIESNRTPKHLMYSLLFFSVRTQVGLWAQQVGAPPPSVCDLRRPLYLWGLSFSAVHSEAGLT